MGRIEEHLSSDQIKQLYTNSNVQNDIPIKPIKKDKYLPYKQILESDKDLREKITNVFSTIPNIPAIHITSKAFINEGVVSDSGFVSNMKMSGFRSLDTNIGVFMVRAGKREIATPQEFVDHPDKFLRELETLIKHYYHHGTRANKNILAGDLKNSRGVPCMLLVDTFDTPLIPGSDYEDHYKIGAVVPGEKIVGEIDLNPDGTTLGKEFTRIANEFLNNTKDYFANKRDNASFEN